jgi:hypothetical protein
MSPTKEYALLSEFSSHSREGFRSYIHVFDRMMFHRGQALALTCHFGTRLTHLPPEGNVEIYMTDAKNTLVENSTLYKSPVKGPSATISFKISGLPIKALGEYKIWARVDGGEPMHLCTWEAIDHN